VAVRVLHSLNNKNRQPSKTALALTTKKLMLNQRSKGKSLPFSQQRLEQDNPNASSSSVGELGKFEVSLQIVQRDEYLKKRRYGPG
jgi:hypothetical protein